MRRMTRPVAALMAGALVLGLAVVAVAPAAAATSSTHPYTGPPVPIPDGLDLSGSNPGVAATATVAVSGIDDVLDDIDLSFDGTSCTTSAGATTVGIDHTWVHDLHLSLTSPEGTTVLVVSDSGGSGNNFCQTVLDDEAATSVGSLTTGDAPFTGSYQPVNPLSAFDGEDPNGVWTLTAQDFVEFDTGTVRAFSLHIDSSPAQPAAAVRVNATTPSAVEGGAPGEFTFTRTGDTSHALTVAYSVSGTATPGDDYDSFGLVTIPAGQSSVTAPVVAAADGVAEGDETVIVTLQATSRYDVTAPISATVTITDPLPPPEPVDPCKAVTDPGFTDVPSSNVHAANIACLAGLGYAEGGPGGAPADQYGPRLQTRRDQMASFVARVAEDLGVDLPADPPDAFTDDDNGNVHELRINQLAAVGIIGDNGEDGPSYFPSRMISRGEMASYLNNLIAAVTGEPLSSDLDAFTDDDASPYEADINGLASVGIVEGTGGGLYDPTGTVQRDSMASFLVRTLQYLANVEPTDTPT